MQPQVKHADAPARPRLVLAAARMDSNKQASSTAVALSSATSSLQDTPGSSGFRQKSAQHGRCRRTCHALLQACSLQSSRHCRFFQLSLDFTTLRWSWDKYVLLYFVDAISLDAAQMTITLHLQLEPDLQLGFRDAGTWARWVAGLQLALTLLTGTLTRTTAAVSLLQDSSNGRRSTDARPQEEHYHNSAGPLQCEGQHKQDASQCAAGGADIGSTAGPAVSAAAVTVTVQWASRAGACDKDVLQHQLVRAALCNHWQSISTCPIRQYGRSSARCRLVPAALLHKSR